MKEKSEFFMSGGRSCVGHVSETVVIMDVFTLILRLDVI